GAGGGGDARKGRRRARAGVRRAAAGQRRGDGGEGGGAVRARRRPGQQRGGKLPLPVGEFDLQRVQLGGADRDVRQLQLLGGGGAADDEAGRRRRGAVDRDDLRVDR